MEKVDYSRVVAVVTSLSVEIKMEVCFQSGGRGNAEIIVSILQILLNTVQLSLFYFTLYRLQLLLLCITGILQYSYYCILQAFLYWFLEITVRLNCKYHIIKIMR